MGTNIVALLLGIALIYWAIKRLNNKTKIVVFVIGALFAISGVYGAINPGSVQETQNKQDAQKASVKKASESKASSRSKSTSESKKAKVRSESKVSAESSSKAITKTSAAKNTKIVADSNADIKKAIKKYAPNVNIKSVNGSYMGQNDTTQITIKGTESLTDKLTVKGMYMDIDDIWKAFKKTDTSHLSNIGISVEYPLTDTGGNSSETLVIKSDMTPQKLSQLNSDGFDYRNVPVFATDYWQHSALPEID